MKHSSRAMAPILGSFVLLVLWPTAASACSACLGNPNSKVAGAINGAIFLMLGFVALMLGGIAAFILTLRKRAQSPTSPPVGVTRMMAAQENVS